MDRFYLDDSNSLGTGLGTGIVYVDNPRIRLYTPREPTITISAEFSGQIDSILTITKSVSPSTIQEGETTMVAIKVENIGSQEIEAVKVTDTIPIGFTVVDGLNSANFAGIKPGDYRVFKYTLQALGSGKFTSDPATVIYRDVDGNSYSGVSNSVIIYVSGEDLIGADSDGDGWSDEEEKVRGTNPYSVDSDFDGLQDTEDPDPTVPAQKMKIPGFEAVFAIAELLAIAYIMLRNRG